MAPSQASGEKVSSGCGGVASPESATQRFEAQDEEEERGKSDHEHDPS